MKVFNTYFYGKDHLLDYINEKVLSEALRDANSVLIQIYSGVIEKERLSELLKVVKEVIPKAEIIGSTTAGEILNGVISLEKVALSINIFENTIFDVVLYEQNIFYNKDVDMLVKSICESITQ